MIKRMQSNGAGGKPKVYSGAIDCLRQILQKEGVGGATLSAPLEMLNEGELFPGALSKNGKTTLLVWFRPRFLAFKEYTALANSFVRAGRSDFLWHGTAVVTKAIPGVSFENKKRPCWLLEKAPGPCESFLSEWWFLISFCWFLCTGFYRGLGLNVIKGIPNAMIQFVAYDFFKAMVLGDGH